MSILRSTLSILLTLVQVPQYLARNDKPPNDSHYSILHITIGKDNFKTVQDKLGPTKECQARYHDGVDIAGYAGPNEILVFEFGEIGGGDVTAFSLSLRGRTTGCPLSPLPARASNLVTKGGVRLGMTEQEFTGVFGEPTTRLQPGHWKYEWTLEKKYTEEEKKTAVAAGHPAPEKYLVGITIETKFEENKLVYFYIAKLEST